MGHRLTPVDIAMGVSVALVWGAGILFAKAALGYFPPILLMAFRFAVTALAFVWFVPIPRGQLIPTVIDQNPCAHLRMPRDMIFHGWSMRLFQAWQHSATMSS